tara:strand:- start:451 stop:717 length:267 start_codon:yes stop_codon:yes gene_type:complete
MTQPKTKQILDIKDDPSLKEAQEFVGGYVELVRVNDGILLVNEEAKLKRLQTNHLASAMYEKTYGDVPTIDGNAIYIPNTLTKSQWFE